MTPSKRASQKVLRARIAYYHNQGMNDYQIAMKLFGSNKSGRVTRLRTLWNIDKANRQQDMRVQKIERDGQVITLCPPAYASGYWPQKTARLTGY